MHGVEAVDPAVSMRTFHRLLANTLLTSITSAFLWFALTFWVYLETRSIVATGVIGGAYSISAALLGPLFGTFVDHHPKRLALIATTGTAAVCFGIASAIYFSIDSGTLLSVGNPWFWVLVLVTLAGAEAAQLRSIVLSTCVTLLVTPDRRDRANGMVGAVTGVSYAVTSVFSGLVIGTLGMGYAYGAAFVCIAGALVHVATIRIAEPHRDRVESADEPRRYFDVRAAMEAILAVPGLMMLVLLTALNNLLGGVLIALLDAYGLELVSVETWGIMFGFISLAFIGGGLAVARFGLGRTPARVVILGNLVIWIVCSVFALQSSIVLVGVGMVIWLALVPVIEAAEQTVLQQSIPYERQGRVFGFAQLLENAAAPLTAFLVAPLAEAVFIPFMTDGSGADWIGSWFGTGTDRGIGLMFTLAGLVGIVVTLIAWSSRSYRRLVADERGGPPAAGAELPRPERDQYHVQPAQGR